MSGFNTILEPNGIAIKHISYDLCVFKVFMIFFSLVKMNLLIYLKMVGNRLSRSRKTEVANLAMLFLSQSTAQNISIYSCFCSELLIFILKVTVEALLYENPVFYC